MAWGLGMAQADVPGMQLQVIRELLRRAVQMQARTAARSIRANLNLPPADIADACAQSLGDCLFAGEARGPDDVACPGNRRVRLR